MFNFSKFSARSFDWLLLVVVILLMSIGLAAVYSIDLSRGLTLVYFKKQAIAGGIGLVLLFLASTFQYNFYRSYAKLFYLASIILLIGVLIFGSTIRGTRGWFAFAGFSFQPVEVAKVAIILILAYVISNFGRRFERPLFFFGTGMVALLMIGLIMLQPDLGSAMVIGLIWFALMLLVKARRVYIVGLIVVVAAVSVLGWFFFLKDYQKSRVMTFVDPASDPLGAGYNVTQAVIAIGAGQWFGRGLGFGSQSQLRFLPEAQTDFVFSVIGEELGFAGALVTLFLFGILFWRLLRIIRQTDDDFVSAAVSGMLVLFVGQLFVNVGANLGLLPITGITLPFVSYGGSSLMINLLLIGVAESMVVRRY